MDIFKEIDNRDELLTVINYIIIFSKFTKLSVPF